MMMRIRTLRACGHIALAMFLVVATASAAPAGDTKEAGNQMGMGLASVGINLFYIPVKIGYSLLGGLTGGLAYAVTGGNRGVADQIWVPSMGGDYVVTPEHLSGDELLYFSGLRGGGGRPAAPEQGASPQAESSDSGAADEFEPERAQATF